MSKGPKYPADIGRGEVNLERVAARTRAFLGIAPDAKVDPFAILGGLRRMRPKVDGKIYPVNYALREVCPGVLAKTQLAPEHPWHPPTIEVVLPEETMYQLEVGIPRALFSLVHELGHVVLHSAEIVRLSAIPDRTAALLRGYYREIPAYRDVEWQADSFTGSFLMPAPALAKLEREKGILRISDLCERFGVSKASAGVRLRVYGGRNKEDLIRVK